MIKRYLFMSKYCCYCSKYIDESSPDEKYSMMITKRGQKIIEFECFHFQCWQEVIKIYEGAYK